jgi:hypothetical protein
VLDQTVKEVNASAPDHRKHSRWQKYSCWRIPVLLAFFSMFHGTFLLSDWFCRMFGILLVDWSTKAVAWPSTACYRLFWKAPPWVFWRALPVALQLLERCLKIYQISTRVLSRMSMCFDRPYVSMNGVTSHLATLKKTTLTTALRNPFSATRLGKFLSHTSVASLLPQPTVAQTRLNSRPDLSS